MSTKALARSVLCTLVVLLTVGGRMIHAATTEPSVREFQIINYAAAGDGVTVNTGAFQRAIDACTAAGGGVVHVPPGKWVTGTVQLKDNVTLEVDKDAFLLGSTSAADYRNVDPFIDGTGSELGYSLIVAVDAKNVGIIGAGTIDGQGKPLSVTEGKYTIRPFLVRWVRCSGVTMKDTTFLNSGAWGINLVQCHDVTIGGLTIRNRAGLSNNDGIDIDSCRGVAVTGCDIDSGDDSLCLKATSTEPCMDITASDCKLQSTCNAIKFGTESIGDFQHVRIRKMQVRQTGMSGIALNSVDGAILSDVVIDDVTIDGVSVPITMRLGARLKTFRPGQTAKPPGAIRDVTIKNVTATGVKQIGMLINGVPGHEIQKLTFSDIKIALPGGGTADDAKIQLAEKEAAYPEYNMFGKVMPAYGMYVRHVDGVTFNNVQITATTPDARPAGDFVDVKGLKPDGFDAKLNGK